MTGKNKPQTKKQNTQAEEILLNQDAIESKFASYFNIEKTENEFVLGFGQKIPGKKEQFAINHRIVVTPKGAKLFNDLLGELLRENDNKK